MASISRRALIGGAFWAFCSTAIGGFALLSLLDTLAERRFQEDLQERHLAAVVTLGNSGGDPQIIDALLFDPEYRRPYSGKYWQIEGPDGQVFTSQSLFDAVLGTRERESSQLQSWQGNGPRGTIRGMSQQVQLADGSLWVVRVASSLADLRQERADIRRNLLVALGVIGALSTAGAGLLTATVLRPLSRLREEVSHRWEAGEALNPEAYPDEVAGLVSDINDLLLRNRDIVDRARRQAADMAHALKTPSAALRNELEAKGLTNAIATLDRIDAHITRSLARVRAENGAQALTIRTDVIQSINRIARLLLSMPISEGKVLDLDLEEDLSVAVDRQDIEELMGNLLENAFKWCDARVAVNASTNGRFALIQIADDGPGIPETQRKQALDAGARLDTSVSGTGLGLAIACDLVHAYGGTLELGDSPELGGLLITITVPRVATRETRNAPALEKAGAP